MANPPSTGYRVIVKRSLLHKLYETDQANLIEIFDRDNNLCALLMRAGSGRLWQVAVKGDDDFEAFVQHHGYKTASSAYPLAGNQIRGVLSIPG